MDRNTRFWRMCGDPPGVVRGVCLSSRVLHFGGDGAEQAAQIGADQGEGGDCRDRDQCRDERILERRNSGLVLTKFVTSYARELSLVQQSNLAQAAAKSR